MANNNFIVKNGLTVNGSFTANSTAVNAAAITATSITVSGNATINSIFSNGSTGLANQVLSSNGTGLYWANVAAGATFVRQTFTANATVNTIFTVTNGYTVNSIDVYKNGVKLINGTELTATNGTSITLATPAPVGTIIDVVGLLSASVYSLNINTMSQGFAFSWTNTHAFAANVTFNSAIVANGSIGTANQVLTSNGSGVYWGDVAAGATFVRQTFTANSTVNTTFTITNGYTVNAIDVYENGIKLIVGTEVTANNGTSITLATPSLVGSTIDVVGLLSASVYSLNINTISQGFAFSWTNNHIFSANVTVNAAIFTVGTSTANAVINTTALTIANSTAYAVVNTTGLSVGSSTSNIVANTIGFTIANSTVTYSYISPTAVQKANTSFFLNANGSWAAISSAPVVSSIDAFRNGII
jgi:hypothetical protein